MASVNRGSENQQFKQIEADSWLSSYLPAISAGVIMTVVLLLAISCSKKSDQSGVHISAPVVATDQSPAASPAPALAPKAAKKIKKHRPLNATYVNSVYGVSFSYPRKYSLEVGTKDSPLPIEPEFLKPGTVEIASVDLPSDLYEETDFYSALLNLAVNPQLTADECAQFKSSSTGSDTVAPVAAKVGGNEFTELESSDQKANRRSDIKYFHLFKNTACYEFALDVETSRKAGEDLAQLDRGKVFERLEHILATARIKPKAAELANQPANAETAPVPIGEMIGPGQR